MSTRSCTNCDLAFGRTQIVWGDLTPQPGRIMLVGEAPGRNEDKVGRPFVGQAGQLLNRLLEEAGLSREEVSITNRVRCWPGRGNPDPTYAQKEACLPWLVEDVLKARPGVVVLMGLQASTWAHPRTKPKMAELRGMLRVLPVGGLSVLTLVTYHPAAALRQGEVVERLIVEDLRKAKELL